MNNAIAQWISVVSAGVMIAALLALGRMLAAKANKGDVDKDIADLRAESVKQAEEGLRQYRELKTAIERLEREINVLDKHSLTSADLTEIKTDLKEALKQIDSMPARVASLEATRNKQSEK